MSVYLCITYEQSKDCENHQQISELVCVYVNQQVEEFLVYSYDTHKKDALIDNLSIN